MITENNIYRHEIIGLKATVSDSANPQLIGTSGRIIYETKSMIILETSSGTKSIPKHINTWTLTADGRDMQVHGSDISRRPVDRLVIKK